MMEMVMAWTGGVAMVQQQQQQPGVGVATWVA